MKKTKTHRIFIREDFPQVEEAAGDVRDGLLVGAKRDARGAVVPGAADGELDVFAVRGVFKSEGRLVG